ncbi:PREDICTED: SAYSvFN domain-containing protein 1-like [Myotis brandtii]|uniref:SAYSvFN domain-containing protein 1-like n=1 Tax=Myotis brandtii TaxID=109478 RepID=UPI000704136C|nr:PREDICTED: SAYSvFN domain-containing protein 1-like [Myotis brandtii]
MGDDEWAQMSTARSRSGLLIPVLVYIMVQPCLECVCLAANLSITFLKVLLWLILLGLFVELEFGLAYFVLPLFYWMYVGTRGPGEKKEGEKSAYSVFNPGCEAIQGTLTAEQLERELQLRPLEGR